MPDPISLSLTPDTGQDCWATVNPTTNTAVLFNETDTSLVLSGIIGTEVSRVGLVFEFPNVTINSDSDAMDPPTLASATLLLYFSGTISINVRVYVEAVQDNRASLFSLTNFPGKVPTLSVLGASGLEPDPETFLIDTGSTSPIEIPLSPARLMSALNYPRTTGNGWGGRIALVIRTANTVLAGDPIIQFISSESALPAPQLVLTYIPFHTGYMVDRGDQPGRATHSMRSGVPAPSYELMEDGWADGIWVTESEWDPDDPFEFDEYVHPTGQGTREDEVPI